MHISIDQLKDMGFVSTEYPTELKAAVKSAQLLWEKFCNLPEDIKRSFPYSNTGAGVGYEDKRVTGNSADKKENFDLCLGDSDWLLQKSKEINNDVISTFVKSALKVTELIGEPIIELARNIETEFEVEGFEDEVRKSNKSYFIRFIHYFEGANPDQETAEAHTDQSGMTPHLFSSAPGLELLTQDMKWISMPVEAGTMVTIPSMQLQLRTKGVLKATVHRVVATPETIQSGRYSAVCFVQFKDTPKYDKSTKGRLQEAHKQDLGFNYRMTHDEFSKLFK